jgi:hypothetical protein
MQCESCATGGFDRSEMSISFKEGLAIMVGPCCSPVPKIVTQGPAAMKYGFELSNTNGFRAYVAGSGFQLTYHKTPEQLVELIHGTQQLQNAARV